MEKPYVKFWGETDEARIFLVDGTHIRKSIDPMFTGYGLAHRQNYVPNGEIWIDGAIEGDEVIEMTAVNALLEIEREQIAKESPVKMDSETMQRLAKSDPDVKKLLNGGSEALTAALDKRGLSVVEKDLTASSVHVASSNDTGGGGMTIEEIQRRAKDLKPKPVAFEVDSIGKVDLRALLEKAQATSFDEVLADIGKASVPRELKAHPEGGAYSPFPHDPQALDKLKPEQIQRFLHAVKNGSGEQREVPIKSLVAIQDKVDPDKLSALQAARDSGEKSGASASPIVAHYDTKNYIVDGHHRAALDYLGGANKINVQYVDLNKPDAEAAGAAEVEPDADDVQVDKTAGQSITIHINAPAVAKAEPVQTAKFIKKSEPQGHVVAKDDVRRIVWCWANVITKGGVPVVDIQEDIITPGELVKCTTEFMVDERVGKTDHQGQPTHMIIHSLPLTYELAKAFGIQTEDEGWLCGLFVFDKKTMDRVDVGDLIALSIGGTGDRTTL